MAGIFAFNETEVLAFFLMLMRMSAFVVSWPIFGSAMMPAPIKILAAVAMTIVIFPVIPWAGIETSLDSMMIILLVIREIFVGLCIGFLARMFLHAMAISGEVISVSMGLSSTQLFNPSTGEQSTTINQFQVMLMS
ncbi:MAG: flagellar biosynthetic protein FliR, partial [Bdellovibrionaceae bacterium]|nr:flagellar biosynthetic protein FliR [Pseudobdellovibrionaceae bacterium]